MMDHVCEERKLFMDKKNTENETVKHKGSFNFPEFVYYLTNKIAYYFSKMLVFPPKKKLIKNTLYIQYVGEKNEL